MNPQRLATLSRFAPAMVKSPLLLVLAAASTASSLSAAVIYSDDFNRADNALTWGSAPVGGTWAYQGTTAVGTGTNAVNQSPADTNDFAVGSGQGLFHATSPGGNFYATQSFNGITLSGNNATWGFNGRYDRGTFFSVSWNETNVVNGNTTSARAGFGMILVASSADLSSASTQGYAVVSRMTNPASNSAATAVIQLIRFDGTFGNQANWTVLAQTGLDVFNGRANEYISAKVDFNGATNTWSLLASGSTSGFTDPLSLSGTALTAVDATYTGIAMTASGIGLYNSGNTANDFRFDNVSFAMIPEPSAFAALAGLGALGLAASRRRRR